MDVGDEMCGGTWMVATSVTRAPFLDNMCRMYDGTWLSGAVHHVLACLLQLAGWCYLGSPSLSPSVSHCMGLAVCFNTRISSMS